MADIYMIKDGLLGEWWHADPGATRDNILDTVCNRFLVSDMQATREQVSQRLFGGFFCNQTLGSTHIYHDVGLYTYLGPNRDLNLDERQDRWIGLLEENSDQPFNRDAPFAEDAPVLARESD